ncbi:hypothetical protein C6V83_03425 [Gordonia iterans]|uniref:Superoxide dismutase n=1 Tax=Gordonia iterans TaxID=1004901 RepID=A0A2S0KCQ6_9ACTN|nr:Fe-Mn family superoxide dismutase [Gordonia iterans]AVL99474.1 hypothetical protein C6V83_03425 [Gordonia iterans]
MTVYTLPELSYDYGALDPHISGTIMELHHAKHHAAYVAGVNTALEKLETARESGDYSAVAGLEKNLAFHLGGHINHSIFWKNLSPDGGDKPTGYRNVKADYVKAFWNVANWADAQERFAAATTGGQILL